VPSAPGNLQEGSMTHLQSQIFAKEVSSCFSVEAKTREAEVAAIRTFILSSDATGQNKRSRRKAAIDVEKFFGVACT
jgi:hypothetical protein